MKAVFADTYYFIALLNATDSAHSRATDYSRTSRAQLLSTPWVFTELADGLSRSPDRHLFRMVWDDFELGPRTRLVWPDESLFRRAMDLYTARPDKQWSLTDCISFVVMQNQGVTEALTGDHHFEQAGFVALLKE
jgi:predicted nucleic acid-binding protein